MGHLQATSHLTEVARSLKHLQGFTHISTAYVNCAQKPGSHVEEYLYPLGSMDGVPLDHYQIAKKFAGLTLEEAEAQVSSIKTALLTLLENEPGMESLGTWQCTIWEGSGLDLELISS